MNATRTRIEVIPAIDLLGGSVVRLYQGDFDRVTQYVQDPVELAQRYVDSGARRLHVVDLDGARTGEPTNLPIIESLAQLDIELQTGGGIRDLTRLRSLLNAGVTRAVIGSVAVETRDVVAEWLAEVGPDSVILAVDIRLGTNGEPELLTRGWQTDTGQPLWPLVEHYLACGATEFLCTDIARDGTLQGPNLALYETCAERYPQAAFIASGGVGSLADLRALERTGIARVVTGKALLDGRLTLEEIRQFSRDA